ncbi:MAG: transposase [Saprospiraceae bacterium]|nr:transposase [Saprospiraceae bacterium]MBK8055515.1 transposase [Saprospiraceae bacterium]
MTKRKLTSVFKSKVVLEALSERYSLSELAQRHQVAPTQISTWKKEFLSNASVVFEKVPPRPQNLCQRIGMNY